MIALRRRAGERDPYRKLLTGLTSLLEAARNRAARAVNTVMTVTYWEIGRRIVEHEQGGHVRAGYGDQLLSRLAGDLTSRLGRGFSRTNLQQMRQFFLAYPPEEICQTVSGKSERGALGPAELASALRLPWSHYVLLLQLEGVRARSFYEAESLRGGWSTRQLARQIDSQFYERALLSRDRVRALARGRRESAPPASEELIRDPFFLEFLNLKDEYSETDLEDALVSHMGAFLMELGCDFCFVGRQVRLRIGVAWHRVDLVFFHRRLRCLVLADLKLGAFSHEDAGQMNLYLNYANELWRAPGENRPVGIIFCARKNEALVRYALGGLENRILPAAYRTALPRESELARELEEAQRKIETRRLLLPARGAALTTPSTSRNSARCPARRRGRARR